MQITTEVEEINVNPVLNFFFALKAPESKMQYPKRFEKFLDYLKLVNDVVWSEIVSVVGRKISIPSSIIDKI